MEGIDADLKGGQRFPRREARPDNGSALVGRQGAPAPMCLYPEIAPSCALTVQAGLVPHVGDGHLRWNTKYVCMASRHVQPVSVQAYATCKQGHSIVISTQAMSQPLTLSRCCCHWVLPCAKGPSPYGPACPAPCCCPTCPCPCPAACAGASASYPPLMADSGS